MAWGSQMQKTYYGDNYWVPTWTVCAVRFSRLCDQRQRKPIHISRIQEFCEIFQIKHITTPQYHPRSNGQAERFVDTLKWALKKASGTPTDKALQQFLQVYRITPNPNTPLAVSPAETMFIRKIRSVFDKLLPKQNKLRKTTLAPKKKKVQPGRKKFTLRNIKITRPVGNVK